MTKETYLQIANDEEFNATDWSGGNFDDAFELGYQFALAEIKYVKE